jgi:hypothetical protein
MGNIIIEPMKATELRIGNLVYNKWVEDGETEHCSVRCVTGYDIHVIDADGCFYQEGTPEGIVITKEWLLKFGFTRGDNVKCNDHFYELKSIGVEFGLNPDNGICFLSHWDLNDNDIKITPRITHVHQLQNLYFALTREELILRK